MKPSEILAKRISFYKECKPGAIFNLYSKCSEFRRFFPEEEGYIRHFGTMDTGYGPIDIEIFRETENGKEGEVLYLETFDYGGLKKRFYSKTEFIMETDGWKIKHELREEEKPEE